jgi:hypothetical protein
MDGKCHRHARELHYSDVRMLAEFMQDQSSVPGKATAHTHVHLVPSCGAQRQSRIVDQDVDLSEARWQRFQCARHGLQIHHIKRVTVNLDL